MFHTSLILVLRPKHHFQVPFSPTPIVGSLFVLLPLTLCYSALSAGITSSFFCASGGAWSNTNKLHPTIGFFFFAFYFFYFLFFVFVCHFCFEVKFDFNVVCEFYYVVVLFVYVQD
jgi:hypothetical protein